MPTKLVCPVKGCGREITEGCGSKGGLPICGRCRAANYDLKKQTPADIEAKRERWHYWEERLDYLEPRIAKMMADAEKPVKRMAHTTARPRMH